MDEWMDAVTVPLHSHNGRHILAISDVEEYSDIASITWDNSDSF